MISVADAKARILKAVTPLPSEVIGLREALGRVLSEDIASRTTQPPGPMSAMDGYAVRVSDLADLSSPFPVAFEIAAGHPADQPLPLGHIARIFTGGQVPEGANAIVIQEDTHIENDHHVRINQRVPEGHYIRPAGLDFQKGDILLQKGRRLNSRDVGLLAAMNIPWISVYRKAKVAILATGDEVVMPGEPLRDGQILSSNSFSLAAMVEAMGAVPVIVGIAKDNANSLDHLITQCRGVDLILSTGGASVGDHDLVQDRMKENGLILDFWRIAMRPGKPLIYGALHHIPYLGLPGNPVSTVVCSLLFAIPLLRTLMGEVKTDPQRQIASLTVPLGENDKREDYIRSIVEQNEDGSYSITPFSRQDSSMLSKIAQANALLIRKPHAPACHKGDSVSFLFISDTAYSV